MKTTDKHLYETPAIVVVEMKVAGVVCTSDLTAGAEDFIWV